MILTLIPCHGLPGQSETTLRVAGDVLWLDGQPCDLGAVPEGGEGLAPAGSAFVGPVTRSGGVLRATLRVILDATAARDQPESWTLTLTGGDVTLPVARRPNPESDA